VSHTESTVRARALREVSDRMAVLVHDILGVAWQNPDPYLFASPFARAIEHLAHVGTMPRGTVPSTFERTSIVHEVDQLQALFLPPLMDEEYDITDEWRQSYWGNIINKALAKTYGALELVPLSTAASRMAATPGTKRTRRTMEKWNKSGKRDRAPMHVITIDGRTFLIDEEVSTAAADPAFTVLPQRKKAPTQRRALGRASRAWKVGT
jgi:hypothetical protein